MNLQFSHPSSFFPFGSAAFFLILLASKIALSLTPQKINSRHFFFLERFAIHTRTHEMNLNPCAYSMSFYVTQTPGNDKLTLNAILNQRSQDILAANNWNVCQYALLLMMMAQVCDMEAGELLHVVAACHIYDRHIPLIKELIQRKPYPAPVVKLNPEVKDFYQFTTDDLIVENYETWPQIKNIPIAV